MPVTTVDTPLDEAAASAKTPGKAEWLARIPIQNPVDRRNAPMLELLLVLLALLPPVAWIYRWLMVSIPWRPGETVSLLSSMALSALAIFSLALIRRGRFQWAVRQLLVVVGLAMLVGYLGGGFQANRFEHPVQVTWLVVAGLMIGRRALWLMYGWTVLVFAVGVWRDAHAPGAESSLLTGGDAAISALIFLFIAIVVDRAGAALRESLAAADARGVELTHANAALHAEIAERERTQAQLVHAQKMEAVGWLASGMAHDFNHLLGLVRGYAQRGRDAGSDAEMRDALSGVESAARRATAVSRKLLNFSRLEGAQPDTFDAGEQMLVLQPMLRQLFGSAVAVDIQVASGAHPVHMDRSHFELIMLNIAANAHHAMPDGGCFTVCIGRSDNGGDVCIDLRDDGTGMPEDVRAQAFDAFFTTKPQGQGSGIGLPVIQDLIAAAGGKITLHSTLGEGTQMRIRLPAASM